MYAPSVVQSISHAKTEVEHAKWELWNFRTQEYLTNALNDDGVAGTVGAIDVSKYQKSFFKVFNFNFLNILVKFFLFFCFLFFV